MEAADGVRRHLGEMGGNHLHVTVRDNGGGITAPSTEQVFTPRWTTKRDGRGFGLSVVRDRVRHLHGAISAYNDGGAVFDVRIPVPGARRPEQEWVTCSVSSSWRTSALSPGSSPAA